MIKFLFLIFLSFTLSFGCKLCSVYSPKTDVFIDIKADKTHIKKANIKWVFAQPFTQELMKIYDINLDEKFDKEEIGYIKENLLSYIQGLNYLTFISYSSDIQKKSNPIDVKKYELYFKNDTLSFEYEINLNYEIIHKNTLYIKIFDEGQYFLMVFDPKKQLLHIPYNISKDIQNHSVKFLINAPILNNAGKKLNLIKDEKIEAKIEENPKKLVEKENKKEKEEKIASKKEESFLDKLTYKLKEYLLSIQKDNNIVSIIFLLMASFVYGVFHALAPGHGKALAFSYFSSHKKSYFQAFVISFATGFVHIIGSLILVLVSIFVLESVLNSFLDNSIKYLTAFCSLIIMILALYILYKKLTKKSNSCGCSMHLDTISFSTQKQNINLLRPSSNKVFVKKDKKQDLIFVLTAGIIPCVGTVLLFVYAFILKTYFWAFMASIFISLGMGVVIFASSFLAVSLHKSSFKYEKFKNFLEIIAPIFMFILAFLLLWGSKVI